MITKDERVVTAYFVQQPGSQGESCMAIVLQPADWTMRFELVRYADLPEHIRANFAQYVSVHLDIVQALYASPAICEPGHPRTLA